MSNEASGSTTDWKEEEFSFADFHWHALDIKTILETKRLEKPELSKVDEVGWTDLMTACSTPASSRVDWIEISGWPINVDRR